MQMFERLLWKEASAYTVSQRLLLPSCSVPLSLRHLLLQDSDGNAIYNTPLPSLPPLPSTRSGTVAFTLQIRGVTLSQLPSAANARLALQVSLAAALSTELGQTFTADQITITLSSTAPASRRLSVDDESAEGAEARLLQSSSAVYVSVSAPVAETLPGTAALAAVAAANSPTIGTAALGAVASTSGVAPSALAVSVQAGTVSGSSAGVPSPAPGSGGGPTPGGGSGNSSPVNAAAIGGGAGGAVVLILLIALIVYMVRKPRATKGAVQSGGQGVAMVSVTINNPIGYGNPQRV